MEKVIYTADECVVCLGDKPVPYFMPCCHQCCCTDCAAQIVAVDGAYGVGCPMCRGPITDVRTIILEDHDQVLPIPAEQLRTFHESERTAYVQRLHGTVAHTKSAAYRGAGKQARAVGDYIGNELAQRQAETAGGERCMAPRSKVTMTVSAADEGGHQLLNVEYKVGRKVHCESYAYCDLDTMRQELLAEFVGKRKPAVLNLATYAPAYYWLLRHHCCGEKGKTVDDAIEQMFSTKKSRTAE